VRASRYGRLLRYAWREKRALAALLLLGGALTAVAALQPWPLKILADHALGGMPAPGWLRSTLSFFSAGASQRELVVAVALSTILLFGLNSLLEAGLHWANAAASQRMIYDLAADLFHRLQRLSLLFHSQSSVGDSLSRLTTDSWSVFTLANSLIVAPWQHLLGLAMVGAISWRMNPELTLYAMATAPVLTGSAFYFGRTLKHQGKLNREAQSRLVSFTHQALLALPMIRAFSAEERNRQRFLHLAEEATVQSQAGSLLRRRQSILNGVTLSLGTAVVLAVGGGKVLSGTLSVGHLLVFLAYQRSLQASFSGLLGCYVTLKSSESGIDRVLEIMDHEEQVQESADARPLPAVRPAGGHVVLEGVTFGYRPGRPVLRSVSLEVRPGETVAVVGPTGAGKSTLASLVPRFFDPWEGRVLLDGCDLRGARLGSVRERVALVLQEPFLLPLSVADNVAYGRPGATRGEVERAARAANAHAFIERLPQGYDTVIGERGATLSGGERQRLAIARALLKDAPILILDEPTSALDAGTEAEVLGALARLMEGRTTLVIAHRLSTVRGADRIVVLEGGRVAEVGSHQELMDRRGTYHRFHALQAAGGELAAGGEK
jgi:ATP-binding cassette, subfamily B, bacterial